MPGMNPFFLIKYFFHFLRIPVFPKLIKKKHTDLHFCSYPSMTEAPKLADVPLGFVILLIMVMSKSVFLQNITNLITIQTKLAITIKC